MARKDWKYVGVHVELLNAIDLFLEDADAERISVKNRQDFVNNLIFQFFEKYKEKTGKDLRKGSITVGPLSLFDE